jgi:uncharacterized protein (TIGR02996 family)
MTEITTEQGLLSDIRANPQDDLPRLAYANWLDENGNSDRAEFIRLQLLLAPGVDRTEPLTEEQRQEHQERADSLLEEHRVTWEAPIRKHVGPGLSPEHFDFYRGFPDELRLIGSEALVRLPDLKEMPIQSVNIAGGEIADNDLSYLCKIPTLLGIVLEAEITDDGLRHLSGLTNLLELQLFFTQVTDDGLRHLSGLTNLSTLFLVGSPQITDDGLRHLSGLTQLKDLHLELTEVTEDGIRRWVVENPGLPDGLKINCPGGTVAEIRMQAVARPGACPDEARAEPTIAAARDNERV